MVQIVTSFSYTYTTDLPPTPEVDDAPHSQGILHANRPPDNGRKASTMFAWIDDAPSLQTAISHLTSEKEGYDEESLLFIPFSSKEAWLMYYPHAKIGLDCSKDRLTFHSTTTSLAKKKKRKRVKKGSNVGLESNPNAGLTNAQRDLLHVEIYSYMDNLKDMLAELEGERKRLGNVCATSDSVAELMEGMVKTFSKVIECNYSKDESDGEKVSFLEHMIGDGLQECLEGKTLKGGSHSREAGLTFEEYYQKLLVFKEEHGHVNVPIRYKDKNLANWVHDVRRNKKDLDKAATETNQVTAQKKSKISQYVRPSALTPQRIAQLESLHFIWSVRNVPSHVSWEDRFKQLMEYFDAHGCWPPHSLSGLGSWVKHQRRRWVTKDKVFMEKYYPQLEEVGFLWRVNSAKTSQTESQIHQLSSVENSDPESQIHQLSMEQTLMYDNEANTSQLRPQYEEEEEVHGSYNQMNAVDEETREIPAGEKTTGREVAV